MKIKNIITNESQLDEISRGDYYKKATMQRGQAGMSAAFAASPEERAKQTAIFQKRDRGLNRLKARQDKERKAEQAKQLADLVARLPELKAEYEAMRAEYKALGGSDWQYADREQNLTDYERKARGMEGPMNNLWRQIQAAEKAQGQQGVAEGSTRAVDSKGRTQREWINQVRAKFPEAKIIQSKMIDGPVHAVLPDGRKTSWSPSVDEARASSASFRSSNARRVELNAMSPEERKAHDDKRAEQQRKRDDARLERERERNAAKKGVAEATMTPDQIAAARAAAPYGYNPQTGKPNPAPAATTPAAPAQPTTPATAAPAAPADPAQAATQKYLDKLGARAGAAPGSDINQVTDAYQQKLLDRMGKRFGLPPGSSMEQVQAAQQAYLDKNDPTAAAQYKQQMANIDADQPAGPAVKLTQPYSKDNVAAAGAQVQGKPAPTTPAPAAAAPATVPRQAAPANPSLGADFDAGLAAQKAGGSPVDIMLAQPAIAGNQKLVDAIGSAYGLPPGSSVEQVKAAAKGQTAAPAIAETKKKEKEADYGDDYQAMVSRVKKLAGLGPLKTVYDPQTRRYKNMPTAVQPGDKK